MFSNGPVLILFFILKCMSLNRFLLAENSTNDTIYTVHRVNSNYSNPLNSSTKRDDIEIASNPGNFNKNRIVGNATIQLKTESLSPSIAGVRNIEKQTEPRTEALSGKFSGLNQRNRQQERLQPTGLPVFPERTDAVYFIVAVIGGAKVWGRTLARTLLDMGPPFSSSMGPPLRPLYVDLPPNGRFSAKVLTLLCQQSEGIPLAGIVVFGDGQSARAVALSGNAMNVPVLWGKGGTANIHGIQREGQSLLQSMLQPSAKEMLEAIRALFLQTHWHSFFVLSDVGSTIVLTSTEGRPLKEPPLTPIILPLPAGNSDVFRQLAQISRSTRGIVLLLCDIITARKIMSEAKLLNMDGGHFIWIWADTSSSTEFFDLHQTAYHPDERVVERPEAVKQYTEPDAPSETNADGSNSHQKYFEDFLRHRDLDNLNSGQTKSIPKSQSDDKEQVQQQQGHIKQKSRQTYLKETIGAGRYIFGLNRDSEESNELRIARGKRQPLDESEVSEEAASTIREADYEDNFKNVDFAGVNFNRTAKRWPFEVVEQNFSQESTTDYSNLDLFDSSSDSELRSTSKTIKPRRTSSYHRKNSTRSSHVLFHHFKDFPIGLLALRPVRMKIDRNFVRSTVRLFATTWVKVDLDISVDGTNANGKSDIPLHSEDQVRRDWLMQRRTTQRFRRRRKKSIRSQASSKLDPVENIKIVNKNRMDVISNSVNSSNLNNNNNNNNESRSASDAQSSDLNNTNNNIELLLPNDKDNSSYNQNLSGLTHPVAIKNRNGSNIIRSSRNLESYSNSTKSKRFNTWWSAKDMRQQKPTKPATVGARDNFLQYRKGSPHYRGGCFGTASALDIKKAQTFSKALKEATTLSLSGRKLFDGSLEKPLTTHFELLNLVPDDIGKNGKLYGDTLLRNRLHSTTGRHIEGGGESVDSIGEAKWRRVGTISGANVQLDTIVWPGGDIVVSGLSVQSKTIFRIVTALAPPFVMQSELDEDGLCLRGLPCHILSPSAPHNLTLMFNAIETRDRLEEDAMEHGIKSPPYDETSHDHSMYITKCCYGLTMDLLENIALELNFEFHLYVVHDKLFGTRRNNYFSYFNSHDMAFFPNGRAHWNEKHEQHFFKEQSTNRRQQAPLGGSNYYSASSERKFNLDLRPDPTEFAEIDENVNERENFKPSDFILPGNSKSRGRSKKADHRKKSVKWNGIIGDLLAGSADMSFAALSVTKARAEAIDFSVPYFHSGVSLLAAPTSKSDIPLLAFLLPFSPELWIAIFTSLNVTAIAVAIYEWLSPFGLNPWGRQRSKNFSMSSALWVMWGLLCGHLVAFKAPKSWPNKFLINVWGGFSVIFIASYTANIAALIAGLFFHNASNRYDVSLLTQRVGAPTASAAESYVQKNDLHLWEHMRKYTLRSIEDGIRALKNGSLDLIMGDTPILDYYRATDHGCSLQRIGDNFVEDTYAIGMTKGFPLKDSISALIAKYSSNGYLDILTEKWYGGLPCFKLDNDIVQPRPLGVAAVAGVFLLLGLGMILGLLILIFEHLFYKYTLPILRHKPKGTVWRSRNIMFFSQKLYRFINCVELVSPHHAARELVHTLRQGQIASLFQKSIKRKEDEQRRRRKSKAQFFEMIQEIRRVQAQERANPKLEVVAEDDGANGNTSDSHSKPKSSPKPRLFAIHRKDARSRSNSSTLDVRRFSNDSILSERMGNIGRRLSRDLTNSPPDFGRRFETFGRNNLNQFEIVSSATNLSNTEKSEETKFDTYNGKDLEKNLLSAKKHQNRRTPLKSDTFTNRKDEKIKEHTLPVVTEGLVHPICQADTTKAVLRDQLHKELRSKHEDNRQLLRVASSQTPAIDGGENQSTDSRHRRQKSLDTLDSRPFNPSPQHSRTDALDSDEIPPALPPRIVFRTNLNQLSLDRLSREDLLKLSESSQSEIHEYLNKSKTKCPSEPP